MRCLASHYMAFLAEIHQRPLGGTWSISAQGQPCGAVGIISSLIGPAVRDRTAHEMQLVLVIGWYTITQCPTCVSTLPHIVP